MFTQDPEISNSEIYAVFFDDGLPKEFHIIGENCTEAPINSVVITQEQWQDLTINAGLRKWDGTRIVDYIRPVPTNIIPDNPTLGDWRVGLALWGRLDEHGNPTTWLNYLNTVVHGLVDSGHPVGQVILQRLEYSNNVKRSELLQLMEYFQFNEDQVNESLRRAYIVSLGDLTPYATIPSKYL